MDLNNYQDFPKIDSQNMLAEMKGLADQVLTAWNEAEGFPLSDFSGITKVIIAGMGGSAIGASLLKAYVAPLASVPIFVHRDYGLPAWATGPETLVIASSHSGNTEESLSAMETALERNNCLVVFSTGGKMAQLASENGIDLWKFKHKGQPRAAVG
jgi:glucose/mannose-6-phosphate isomerase